MKYESKVCSNSKTESKSRWYSSIYNTDEYVFWPQNSNICKNIQYIHQYNSAVTVPEFSWNKWENFPDTFLLAFWQVFTHLFHEIKLWVGVHFNFSLWIEIVFFFKKCSKCALISRIVITTLISRYIDTNQNLMTF